MRRTFILLLIVLGAIGTQARPQIRTPDRGATSNRIISLAPSVTEVLFAIGLGPRVVGVTSYCKYPPQVTRIAKIGGYIKPNYEAIVRLKPDLAVLLSEHADVEPAINALGIKILRLDHNSVSGILASIIKTGDYTGVAPQAEALLGELQNRLDAVSRAVANRPKPRVVLCLGRDPDGTFRSMHAAGPGGIYDDLIARAGGINAIPPGPVLHPVLSVESLLRLNPDVIVEFASEARNPTVLRAQWQSLDSLQAVRAGRVFVFTGDFIPVPGPRLVRFVGDLARVLHPEAQWSRP